MATWKPGAAQKEQWEQDGYFILRGLIPREAAVEVRGVIKNTILLPEPDARADRDPMDPMGDSPAARAARFRKLSRLGLQSPLIWDTIYTGDPLLAVARFFLGDDLLLKFNSCFIKPARTGSATPWHQDNGLWRDGETEPFNFWMALDPATRENGCLQCVPGSHKGEIVQHVLYPDSIHGELPRDRVAAVIAGRGVHHIELEPGDTVFWHSTLWHYSAPNTSEKGRIGIAGVYTTPAVARAGRRFWSDLPWVMKAGRRCEQFPPEMFPLGDGQTEKPEPYPKAA